METWYGAGWYDRDLEEVSVVSHTEKFITIETTDWRGQKTTRRCPKSSEHENYFPSALAGWTYLAERERRILNSLKEKVSKSESLLRHYEEKLSTCDR